MSDIIDMYAMLRKVRAYRAQQEQSPKDKRKVARQAAMEGGIGESSRDEAKDLENIEQSAFISTEAVERWEIPPSLEEIDRMNAAWEAHNEELKIQTLKRWEKRRIQLEAKRKRWRSRVSPDTMRRIYD